MDLLDGCASRQPVCPPAPGAATATAAPGASCSRAASHRRRAPGSRFAVPADCEGAVPHTQASNAPAPSVAEMRA
jgi:hypothetical protein